MQVSRRAVAAVSSLALCLGAGLVTAPGSIAATKNRSLTTVLTSDGNRFDKNSGDFDVLTEAVLAVLAEKPDSGVAVLSKGRQRLTAFAPTDRAFRVLAYDLTGTWVRGEKALFNAVAALGIDTVETVLLYHVVPGATVNSTKVLRSDDAELTTAGGGTVLVDVLSPTSGAIRLQDVDSNDVDPMTVPALLDINKGNKQIAHGISYVLRPADL